MKSWTKLSFNLYSSGGIYFRHFRAKVPKHWGVDCYSVPWYSAAEKKQKKTFFFFLKWNITIPLDKPY